MDRNRLINQIVSFYVFYYKFAFLIFPVVFSGSIKTKRLYLPDHGHIYTMSGVDKRLKERSSVL